MLQKGRASRLKQNGGEAIAEVADKPGAGREQENMTLCPVCGNEGEAGSAACRYCGSVLADAATDAVKTFVLHRKINLERGRPTVATALKRLELEIGRARNENVMVLSLIHGYGSSGKGGSIRLECRKILDYMVQQKKLKGFIGGEEFNRRSGAGKALIRRFPELEQRCGSEFNNPGVTIVLL